MITPVEAVRRKTAAEAWAIEHDVAIPKGFHARTPFVGKYARVLVRRIEAKRWPKLPPTGEFNTRVLALLFPPKKYPIGVVALGNARAELSAGVKEHPSGSNAGPRVSQYEAILGLNHQPWCACFVTWCLRQAGWKQKGWNQAYVPSWVATAHNAQHGLRVIGVSEVKQGDLACYDWEHNGVADHIGFVLLPPKNGSFNAIEGNTSLGSDSNGGEVMLRVRNVRDVACFIRVDA